MLKPVKNDLKQARSEADSQGPGPGPVTDQELDQAEELAEIFAAQDDVGSEDPATKADLQEMELRLQAELGQTLAAGMGKISKTVAGLLLAQAVIIVVLVRLLLK
jgi:hypothetical protein